MSMLDAVEKVLTEAGTPLSYRDITSRIVEGRHSISREDKCLRQYQADTSVVDMLFHYPRLLQYNTY